MNVFLKNKTPLKIAISFKKTLFTVNGYTKEGLNKNDMYIHLP